MNIVTKTDASALTRMATAIRVLAMDAVEAASSGHPGAPMGMADIAAVLWGRIARVDPSRPDWPDRDRVILSAGHASMLLYGVHHLLGYEDMGVDQLRRFRQLGAGAAGHPEYGHAQGIEMTTGPLGQGIATSVGMALAERMANARHGDALVDHFTYVLCGDGCLMEGVSQEAADLAGHLGLGRLIVLWDDNGITIDGGAEMSTSTDQRARFAASGWHVQAIDGHDHDAIEAAIRAAQADPRPSLIACRTVIGFGAPNKQGGHAVHGAPLGAEEIAAARVALDWPHAPFEIPQEIRDDWLDAAARGRKAREAWEARLDNSPNGAALREDLTGPDRAALAEAIATCKAGVSLRAPAMATRIASQKALEAVNGTVRQMIGGSADLTGSNNTKTAGMTPVTRDDYAGRYLHWGVREHGMACAMNGLALHGGFRPYGGGFLVFSDYCRPAIRLAALMQVPAVHVLTHDSIGLGEDGPTHQPVEHLAALRAIPGLLVFRPCDGVETAEAWEIAATETRPSALCLSRQSLPTLRVEHRPENLSSRGAYLLRDVPAPRHATLIATGSEVSIAMAAAHALAAEGLRIAVVSAPCFALFEEQPESYRDAVLGHAPRVGVEAALRRGWDGMLDRRDGFVGMTGFGASAPAHELYRHFGITPEAVADAVRARLTT